MEIKWIKISTDIFSNRKIKMISHMQDGDAIIVIWLRLLVLAGELNDGGAVYLTESKPYTEELLAVQMEKPRELIALALRTFEAYGMIEMEDGFIYITNWEKYQNIEGMERIREQNRLRKQKQRSKEKDVTELSHVTSRDSHATDKNRKDKKREDKNSLLSRTIAQWQSNVDANEANKEIRT